MKWLRVVMLFPFAMLYRIITGLRNRLYDQGLKPSVQFDLPVIGVGNLAVGGTGKTPMIEYLVRLLGPQHTLATLSRGYGRKTRGFRLATTADTAETIGDEPLQFFKKYGDKVTVAVGEERAFAIPNILQEKPGTAAILLDDAFQHRAVRPSLNILLSDFNRPFYNDFIMPSGNLREGRLGARRAHVVVITKCAPDLSDDAMMTVEQQVRHYATCPVFFTTIRYGDPLAAANIAAPGNKVVVVTGIANPAPLLLHLDGRYEVAQHLRYADHHAYTASDVQAIQDALKAHGATAVITTEKDYVKLSALPALPLFYVPIEVDFLKNGQDFDAIVQNSIQRAHEKNIE